MQRNIRLDEVQTCFQINFQEFYFEENKNQS